MTLRVVIDTNIWIRILLKGRVTLPILEAFNEKNFQLIISQVLFDEFHEVWNRPRLKKYIDINQALRLEKQLRSRSIWVETKTIPPHCRDPKDLPIWFFVTWYGSTIGKNRSNVFLYKGFTPYNSRPLHNTNRRTTYFIYSY